MTQCSSSKLVKDVSAHHKLLTLTCGSGQAQAEEQQPRHGHGASLLPHHGLMAASDWSRASILASDWSATGDNHSVSRHVTDSPGECTSCCDKNIESLNSLCATRLRTRVMCSRGISLKRFITFVVFLVWCLALLLQSEFWSFLLCSLNYVDLYFSFMAQTASFL